jgi:hypothetical protein
MTSVAQPRSAAIFIGDSRRRVSGAASNPPTKQSLFVAVLFVVGFRRLFSVAARMDRMRPRYMGMVRRFLVLPSFVVLCRFNVVAGSVSKIFVRLLMVFGSFFRHCSFLPDLRQR